MRGFVGKLDFGEIDPYNISKELWLEQPFGWIDGNIMQVCVPGSLVNGASIPKMLWPLLDSPLSERNRVWSTPHDCGYSGTSIYLNLSHPSIMHTTYIHILNNYTWFPEAQVPRPHRLWHDKQMFAAMGVMLEGLAKRVACFSGVRIGGSSNWRKRV